MRESIYGSYTGLGRVLRRHDATLQRKYRSRYSNAVFHIDGLHKLILWGFVIHGIIDGHDHVVSSVCCMISHNLHQNYYYRSQDYVQA